MSGRPQRTDSPPGILPPGEPSSLTEWSGGSLPERFALRPATLPQRIAGALSARAALVHDRTAALFRREAELATPANLAPVALAAGVAAYFAAPYEPVPGAAVLAMIAPALLAWRLRMRGLLFHVLCALSLAAAGMSAAQWRTERAGGPVIAAGVTGQLRGIVVDTTRNRRGDPRYLLRPLEIEGVPQNRLPRLVRLSSASAHDSFRPGDTLSGRVRIQPMMGPAFPGGYDFGFYGWLDGLGGTGWFIGPPAQAAVVAAPSGLGEAASIQVNRMRLAIADRLRAGLPGEPGDIAVALITGDRTGLDDDTQESLRASGLAHILAISGLHMALVTLAVVGSARFLLSLFPALALQYPVRKWAAGGGFAAATIYLLISGAAVATQRAYLMIAIMLVATLIDRRAITIRNVAIAASIILLATPEALLEPGFQMSFAAAAALVAAYGAVTEWRRRRRMRRELRNAGQGMASRIAHHVAGLAFTSLVAGLATGVFAAWHFHRIAPLGLVANLLAMPVVSFAVMPLALVAMALMPFGFEGLVLRLLGASIETVVSVSDWVNGFPAPSVTGAQPASVLLLASAGLVVLTALRTRLRLLGLLPVAGLLLAVQKAPAPDLVIFQDGSAVAMRDAEGKLALLYPRRNRFVADIWIRAWSGDEAGDAASLNADCDKDYCRATSPSGVSVAVVFDPARIQEACAEADIVAAPRLRWINCRDRTPKLVLKRRDFETGGTHAVSFSGPPSRRKFEVATSLGPPGRPWNLARIPPAPAETAFSTGGSTRRAGPAPSPDPD